VPLLRVFLSGRASDELDALRARLMADANLELVERIELADAVITLPRKVEQPDHPIEHLTTREHDVLALVADGLPNREIASALAISEHTVKFHLASIFGKLGASTRTEAVQRGLRLGVIEI
jgi:ATP/maltotriose-dependent transcriptional regulator MalT